MKWHRARLSVLPLLIVFLLSAHGSAAGGNEGDASADKAGAMKKNHREGEVLVKFRQSLSEKLKSTAHQRYGFRTLREFRSLGILRVKLDEAVSIEEALEAYRADPSVQYAEPNYRVTAVTVPNDPYLHELWNLNNTGQNGGVPGADIQALQAWDITTGSGDVVVAVIDTGVDYKHADISANMWLNTAEYQGMSGLDDDNNGYIDDIHGINTSYHNSDPMDDHGHGTHVAGTIGARGNNGIGVVGVSWNLKIMACKFLDKEGSGYIDGAIACLEYVRAMKDRGVNIIATNNSWGGGGYSQALFDAIKAQEGILFVAAAGNSYGDNDGVPFYPASYRLPNVISVGATDHHDHKADFSNRGRRTVHVSAPGVDIVSLRAEGTDMYDDGEHFVGDSRAAEDSEDSDARYYRASGTSMATPHVTGLAALIKAQDPRRNWSAIRNLLLSGGDLLSSLNDGTVTGRRVNAYGSLTCSNSTVFSALEVPSKIEVGVPVTLSALSINCASAVGPVTVGASADGVIHEVIQLRDDGRAPDRAPGDGIYTATWSPRQETEYLIFSSPGGTERVKIPLIMTTDVLSAAIAGTQFSQTLKASGGVKPHLWSIESGSLPDGMRLNGLTGEISGTPTTTGQFSFTARVSDADTPPGSVTKSLAMRVYGQPDLVVTAVSGPSAATPGQQMTVTATVRNQGGEAAGTSRLAFYLSPDPETTTADMYLGFADISILGAGEQETRSMVVAVPTNLSGTYYWGALADVHNWIRESEETNNSLTGNQVTFGRPPDLIVAALSGPTSAVPGQQIQVTCAVKNQGPGTAGSFRVGFYLSRDPVITSGDTFLGYATLNSLTGGGQQTVTARVAIPLATAAGAYYLGAIADYTGVITESDETNNARVGNQIAIGPDLVVLSVSGPTTARAGSMITVTQTVKNQGQAGAKAFRVAIYLSTDPTVTTDDIYLGQISVSSLGPRSQRTLRTWVTIPSSLVSGKYYLGAVVDRYNSVAETNETNNGLSGSQVLVTGF